MAISVKYPLWECHIPFDPCWVDRGRQPCPSWGRCFQIDVPLPKLVAVELEDWESRRGIAWENGIETAYVNTEVSRDQRKSLNAKPWLHLVWCSHSTGVMRAYEFEPWLFSEIYWCTLHLFRLIDETKSSYIYLRYEDPFSFRIHPWDSGVLGMIIRKSCNVKASEIALVGGGHLDSPCFCLGGFVMTSPNALGCDLCDSPEKQGFTRYPS